MKRLYSALAIAILVMTLFALGCSGKGSEMAGIYEYPFKDQYWNAKRVITIRADGTWMSEKLREVKWTTHTEWRSSDGYSGRYEVEGDILRLIGQMGDVEIYKIKGKTLEKNRIVFTKREG